MGINTGALYIIFIMLAVTGLAYIASGPTPQQTPTPTGPEAVVYQNMTSQAHANLQLYNFNGATITPPVDGLCTKGSVNVHPEALVAYSPQQAGAVTSTGTIRLWVSDTLPIYISPDEVIIPSSGAVKTHGDLGVRAPDNFILEPQLYVIPQTEKVGGQPYFPSAVLGNYNNGTPQVASTPDALPPYALPQQSNTAEFVWNVKDIGLTDNDYQIEFIVHDGHQKLGVKCFSLRVYTPPETENQRNKLPL